MWPFDLDLKSFFAIDIDPVAVLPSSHDPTLVLLSFFVAVLAGFAFVHLLHRIAERESSPSRHLWMVGGALIMGLGIWAMHFIGMQAYELPILVTFDPWITLVSAIPAVLASAWNLQIVARTDVSRTRLVIGGVVLGVGIGLMHYTGMAAVHFDAFIRYDPALFALSLVVAIALAMGALWVAFKSSRRTVARTLTGEIIAAVLIGSAVAGMHYTAMSSTICLARTNTALPLRDIGPGILAGATAAVASLILIAGIAAVVFDRRLSREIFQRKEAVNQAQINDARLRLIMDNVADAVITLDSGGSIETCNAAAEKIFGRRADAIIGRPLTTFISETESGAGKRKLMRYLLDPSARKPEGDGFEVVGRREDGSMVFLEAVLSEVQENGRTVLIAALRDITERMVAALALAQAKEEAEKANHAKSEFISHMSHELRTPLNAVLGFSEIIRTACLGPVGNDKYAEYADNIFESGEYLLSLVNDLLDFSAIEDGRRPLDLERLGLHRVVHDSVNIVRNRAEEKGIKVITNLAAGMEDMIGDARAIQQVLLNLLSNSIKFTSEGGTIQVSTLVVGDLAQITVADTGIGIPEEAIPTLTNPFRQFNKNPYRREKGWGLGLSISKSLIDLHGGRMEIESEVDKGTTITVFLPLAGPEGAKVAVPE